MIKKELRKIFSEKRRSIDPFIRPELETKLVCNILDYFDLDHKTIHIFLSIERHNEINTEALMNSMNDRFKNITWVIPKTDLKMNTLDHFILDNKTKIELNEYGIPEPTQGTEISPIDLDLVFVPLLAADLKGHRVGFGKGYYDRFLAECSDKCEFIGLSLFEPIDKIDDIDEHDIPLHFIASPRQILKIEQE